MRSPRLAKPIGVFCLLGVLVLSAAPTLHAQTQGAPSATTDLGSMNLLQQLRQRFSGAGLAAGTLALEGALNPDEYIVGPGDQFTISIGGVVPIREAAQVSAEGHLILSDAGQVAAAGRTLRDVQTEAVAMLRRQYENVPIEISLAQPRQFYVHISGAVPEPGRYLVMPVSRVSEALEMAYAARAFELQYLQATAQIPANVERPEPFLPSATSERPRLSAPYRPSLRNVRLTRRDGTQISIDLFRYYTTGDPESNPLLLDGDVITVPVFNEEQDAVVVTGEAPYPGTYAYRPGDTVLDVLLLATGPSVLERLGDVRLIRRGSDGLTRPMLLHIPDLRAADAAPIPLQPGDRLDVLKPERASASIYGFVQYPGTYPIESGKTTLRELLEMGGGLKPDANVRAAYVERRESNYFKGDGRISDLDFFGRTYLKTELRRNRIAIDVAQVLETGGERFVLQNNDVVVFPRDEGTVFVTGNVIVPGYVPFEPGRKARHYIEAAGGEGPDTKGIYVFAGGTGAVQTGDDVLVRSGDTIFVNREPVAETPELQSLLVTDRTSRRQTRLLSLQTVIAGVSTIAGLITAFAAITR